MAAAVGSALALSARVADISTQRPRQQLQEQQHERRLQNHQWPATTQRASSVALPTSAPVAAAAAAPSPKQAVRAASAHSMADNEEELVPVSAVAAAAAALQPQRRALLLQASAVVAAAAASYVLAPFPAEAAEGGELTDLVRFYKPDGEERNTNPYSFAVPRTWRREPVSLNDAKLYGTDCSFFDLVLPANGGTEARVDVFVLPVGNADKETIEEVGDPEDVIGVFGPSDQPGRVKDSMIERLDGDTYYFYELAAGRNVSPCLMSIYVSESQLYILSASAPKTKFRTVRPLLTAIRDSFRNERRIATMV